MKLRDCWQRKDVNSFGIWFLLFRVRELKVKMEISTKILFE